MPYKIIIFSFITLLTSCSFFNKDNLQKFADGDVAVWKYADDSITSEEKDCSKVIENSNGVIVFQYVKDERLITFLHWGKKTTYNKFIDDKASRFTFGKDAGWANYFKVSGSKRSGDSLTLTSIREDGLISENYFSTSDGNSMFASGWSYLNPNEKQVRQYNALKEQILKKQSIEVCKTSTLLEYVKNSEALNKKMPDSHMFLGSRFIDLVPDDPAVSPLPNSLEKIIFECLPHVSDDTVKTSILNCPIKNPSPAYKARSGETFNIIANTPRCCLNTVDISSNQLTYEEPLDLFKNLPGVEKKEVECKELSKDNYSGYAANFFEIYKNGAPKFSIREVSSGGSGGSNTYTTVYYGMPKINCSRISDIDNSEKESRLLKR